ncbi:MAG TPA: hypothetical protein VIV58_06075 [Kofleriaceae bacterium]
MIKRLLVLCLFASGCGLYWGGDDTGDDVCNELAGGGTIASEGYRDPQSGVCQYFGGGGGGGCCYDSNGNGTYCAAPATGQTLPNWGQCGTACDGLDENTCIATPSCHAAYLAKTQGETGPTTTSFLGCWATAQGYASQPPTECAGLDAQSCSERDFCSMVYTSNMVSSQQFGSCIDEKQGACGIDINCPMGSHCEQQCTPCNSMGCQDTCAPTCVPDAGWGECTGQITCNSAPPACPANTTAGIANGCWTGYCIPSSACGTPNPGTCYDTVTCGSAPPACPSGTLPGVVNGCWSGYCIPTASCEQPACETLASEAACSARADCTPVYTGTDCTCTMTGGCTCATETYAKCETGWML